MLSGREIIIHDNSGLGHWCRALKCGFPFTSEAEIAFPKLKEIKGVNQLSQNTVAYNLRMNISIPEDVIGFRGMDSYATKWFHYAGSSARPCVRQITGCSHELIGCVERFAFRQLLAGGFNEKAIPTHVSGLSPVQFQNMLNNPYDSLPRFDAGVHIRAQSSSLESNRGKTIIDMSEYILVFERFEKALSKYFFGDKPLRFNVANASDTDVWPRIFISCDDIDIRKAFVDFLLNRTGVGRFIPVYVNTTQIVHTKHIDYGNTSIITQNIVDTAFDWYALSLVNVCFAWRSNYVMIVSTFMQSATRVSLMKPTNAVFKSAILHRSGSWHPSFDYVDNITEIEMHKKTKKKKG